MSKVKELYVSLRDDPDFPVPEGETRESAAWNETSQRTRQHQTNAKALSMGTESAVEKLFKFTLPAPVAEQNLQKFLNFTLENPLSRQPLMQNWVDKQKDFEDWLVKASGKNPKHHDNTAINEALLDIDPTKSAGLAGKINHKKIQKAVNSFTDNINTNLKRETGLADQAFNKEEKEASNRLRQKGVSKNHQDLWRDYNKAKNAEEIRDKAFDKLEEDSNRINPKTGKSYQDTLQRKHGYRRAKQQIRNNYKDSAIYDDTMGEYRTAKELNEDLIESGFDQGEEVPLGTDREAAGIIHEKYKDRLDVINSHFNDFRTKGGDFAMPTGKYGEFVDQQEELDKFKEVLSTLYDPRAETADKKLIDVDDHITTLPNGQSQVNMNDLHDAIVDQENNFLLDEIKDYKDTPRNKYMGLSPREHLTLHETELIKARRTQKRAISAATKKSNGLLQKIGLKGTDIVGSTLTKRKDPETGTEYTEETPSFQPKEMEGFLRMPQGKEWLENAFPNSQAGKAWKKKADAENLKGDERDELEQEALERFSDPENIDNPARGGINTYNDIGTYEGVEEPTDIATLHDDWRSKIDLDPNWKHPDLTAQPYHNIKLEDLDLSDHEIAFISSSKDPETKGQADPRKWEITHKTEDRTYDHTRDSEAYKLSRRNQLTLQGSQNIKNSLFQTLGAAQDDDRPLSTKARDEIIKQYADPTGQKGSNWQGIPLFHIPAEQRQPGQPELDALRAHKQASDNYDTKKDGFKEGLDVLARKMLQVGDQPLKSEPYTALDGKVIQPKGYKDLSAERKQRVVDWMMKTDDDKEYRQEYNRAEDINELKGLKGGVIVGDAIQDLRDIRDSVPNEAMHRVLQTKGGEGFDKGLNIDTKKIDITGEPRKRIDKKNDDILKNAKNVFPNSEEGQEWLEQADAEGLEGTERNESRDRAFAQFEKVNIKYEKNYTIRNIKLKNYGGQEGKYKDSLDEIAEKHLGKDSTFEDFFDDDNTFNTDYLNSNVLNDIKSHWNEFGHPPGDHGKIFASQGQYQTEGKIWDDGWGKIFNSPDSDHTSTDKHQVIPDAPIYLNDLLTEYADGTHKNFKHAWKNNPDIQKELTHNKEKLATTFPELKQETQDDINDITQRERNTAEQTKHSKNMDAQLKELIPLAKTYAKERRTLEGITAPVKEGTKFAIERQVSVQTRVENARKKYGEELNKFKATFMKATDDESMPYYVKQFASNTIDDLTDEIADATKLGNLDRENRDYALGLVPELHKAFQENAASEPETDEEKDAQTDEQREAQLDMERMASGFYQRMEPWFDKETGTFTDRITDVDMFGGEENSLFQALTEFIDTPHLNNDQLRTAKANQAGVTQEQLTFIEGVSDKIWSDPPDHYTDKLEEVINPFTEKFMSDEEQIKREKYRQHGFLEDYPKVAPFIGLRGAERSTAGGEGALRAKYNPLGKRRARRFNPPFKEAQEIMDMGKKFNKPYFDSPEFQERWPVIKKLYEDKIVENGTAADSMMKALGGKNAEDMGNIIRDYHGHDIRNAGRKKLKGTPIAGGRWTTDKPPAGVQKIINDIKGVDKKGNVIHEGVSKHMFDDDGNFAGETDGQRQDRADKQAETEVREQQESGLRNDLADDLVDKGIVSDREEGSKFINDIPVPEDTSYSDHIENLSETIPKYHEDMGEQPLQSDHFEAHIKNITDNKTAKIEGHISPTDDEDTGRIPDTGRPIFKPDEKVVAKPKPVEETSEQEVDGQGEMDLGDVESVETDDDPKEVSDDDDKGKTPEGEQGKLFDDEGQPIVQPEDDKEEVKEPSPIDNYIEQAKEAGLLQHMYEQKYGKEDDSDRSPFADTLTVFEAKLRKKYKKNPDKLKDDFFIEHGKMKKFQDTAKAEEEEAKVQQAKNKQQKQDKRYADAKTPLMDKAAEAGVELKGKNAEQLIRNFDGDVDRAFNAHKNANTFPEDVDSIDKIQEKLFGAGVGSPHAYSKEREANRHGGVSTGIVRDLTAHFLANKENMNEETKEKFGELLRFANDPTKHKNIKDVQFKRGENVKADYEAAVNDVNTAKEKGFEYNSDEAQRVYRNSDEKRDRKARNFHDAHIEHTSIKQEDSHDVFADKVIRDSDSGDWSMRRHHSNKFGRFDEDGNMIGRKSYDHKEKSHVEEEFNESDEHLLRGDTEARKSRWIEHPHSDIPKKELENLKQSHRDLETSTEAGEPPQAQAGHRLNIERTEKKFGLDKSDYMHPEGEEPKHGPPDPSKAKAMTANGYEWHEATRSWGLTENHDKWIKENGSTGSTFGTGASMGMVDEDGVSFGENNELVTKPSDGHFLFSPHGTHKVNFDANKPGNTHQQVQATKLGANQHLQGLSQNLGTEPANVHLGHLMDTGLHHSDAGPDGHESGNWPHGLQARAQTQVGLARAGKAAKQIGQRLLPFGAGAQEDPLYQAGQKATQAFGGATQAFGGAAKGLFQGFKDIGKAELTAVEQLSRHVAIQKAQGKSKIKV